MYQIEKTYLITTDNWFTAPNGIRYNAAFGTIKSIVNATEQLGITVNARSMNFYLEVGNLTIAGCQIHYAIQCERDTVNFGPVNDFTVIDGRVMNHTRGSYIYDADN